MKTLNFKITLLFLFAFSLTGFSQKLTFEQNLNNQTRNPLDWSIALDEISSAPNQKILLENDDVRVLEVTLAPEEIEKSQNQKRPSVLYIQEAGDFINTDADGNVILDTRNLKEPLIFPMTIWKNSDVSSTVTNLSKTKPMRLIRVEMKQ